MSTALPSQETRAARSYRTMDLPTPGNPPRTVVMANGTRPGHSHSTFSGRMSTARTVADLVSEPAVHRSRR